MPITNVQTISMNAKAERVIWSPEKHLAHAQPHWKSRAAMQDRNESAKRAQKSAAGSYQPPPLVRKSFR
jgi:hypothetical protein